MMNRKGYTLMEIMVVTGLIGIFFSALLGILINSDTYWNKGQNKITEQYEARLAMDTIVKDLRESNTYWNITISSNEILFYKPDFNATGYLSGIHWVGYKLDPANPNHLIRVEDSNPPSNETIATRIQSIVFAGSTDSCGNFTFTSGSLPQNCNCPRIRVTITAREDKNFTLTSDVALRNKFFASAGAPPEEGEF